MIIKALLSIFSLTITIPTMTTTTCKALEIREDLLAAIDLESTAKMTKFCVTSAKITLKQIKPALNLARDMSEHTACLQNAGMNIELAIELEQVNKEALDISRELSEIIATLETEIISAEAALSEASLVIETINAKSKIDVALINIAKIIAAKDAIENTQKEAYSLMIRINHLRDGLYPQLCKSFYQIFHCMDT